MLVYQTSVRTCLSSSSLNYLITSDKKESIVTLFDIQMKVNSSTSINLVLSENPFQ